MKPSKRLALAKETLTELTPYDLAAVVGGEPTQPTPPVYGPTHECTGYYQTIPVTHCLTTQ